MEANFIGEVPDHLKCVVCHYVFKDPVMIIECGHRLCKSCYEEICNHSALSRSPLLCPIDRKKVETEKVIDDKGIQRAVLDLKVKCDLSNQGCTWEGDLGRLKEHVAKNCSVTSLKKFMDKIEGSLKEKDESIENLQEKLSFHDAQASLTNQKVDVFMKSVKEKLASLEDAQDVFQDSKMTEFMRSVKEQLATLEGKLYQKDEEICLLKYQISLLRTHFVDARKEISVNGKDSVLSGNTDLINLKGNISASFDAHDKEESESEWRKVKDRLKQKDNKITQLEYQLARVTNDLYQARALPHHNKLIRNDMHSCASNISSSLIGHTVMNSTKKISNSNDSNIRSYDNDKNNHSDDNKENEILISSYKHSSGEKKRKMDSDQAGSSKGGCHDDQTPTTVPTSNRIVKEKKQLKLMADIVSSDTSQSSICENEETGCENSSSIHTGNAVNNAAANSSVDNESSAPVSTKSAGSLSYKCMFCRRYFDSHIIMIRHNIEQHSRNGPFQCDICRKEIQFHQFPYFRRHVESCNGTWFQCKVCIVSFSDEYMLKCHLDQHKSACSTVQEQNTATLSLRDAVDTFDFGKDVQLLLLAVASVGNGQSVNFNQVLLVICGSKSKSLKEQFRTAKEFGMGKSKGQTYWRALGLELKDIRYLEVTDRSHCFVLPQGTQWLRNNPDPTFIMFNASDHLKSALGGMLMNSLPTEVDDNAWDEGGPALLQLLQSASDDGMKMKFTMENLCTLRRNRGYTVVRSAAAEEVYYLHREGLSVAEITKYRGVAEESIWLSLEDRFREGYEMDLKHLGIAARDIVRVLLILRRPMFQFNLSGIQAIQKVLPEAMAHGRVRFIISILKFHFKQWSGQPVAFPMFTLNSSASN